MVLQSLQRIKHLLFKCKILMKISDVCVSEFWCATNVGGKYTKGKAVAAGML